MRASVWPRAKPYLAWDGVLLVAAAFVLLAFIVVEDGRSAFWNGYGVQTTATMLGALALLMSIRLGVANLAIAGIAVFASSASIFLVGDEVSAPVLIVVAAAIGALIGLVLAVIVVGLRVPSWGATIGLAGLLGALSIRIIEPGSPQLLRGGSTLVDLGLGVLVLATLATVAVCAALFWLGRPRSVADVSLGEPDSDTDLAGIDTRLQIAALLVSSVLAAIAGTLLVLRFGVADGRIGSDFARPFAVVLLAGVSLRGFGAGIVGLVAATVIVETLSSWAGLLDWVDPIDLWLIPGALSLVGLVIGGVLELMARRSETESLKR